MSNLTIGLDVGDKFSALYIVDGRWCMAPDFGASWW
jgi:hypothetical protein